MRILLFIFILVSINSCNSLVDGYTNKISYGSTDTLVTFLNHEKNGKQKIGIYDVNDNQVIELNIPVFSQEIVNDKPWKNGFGYLFNVKIPFSDLQLSKSGLYYIDKEVLFVFKGNGNEKITVVYPSNTINAYNKAGGKSLYFPKEDKAQIVSFLRPHQIQGYAEEFLKWLPKQNFGAINYICDQDLDDYETFKNSDLIIIPGHNEYWTRKARENFDQFIEEGNDAIILSGNTMWWQARYQQNKSQLICHKYDSLETTTDSSLFTITWDRPELNYPIEKSIGADFKYGGYGLDKDEGWDGFKVLKPNSPLLEQTDLDLGDVISIPTAEYDGVPFVDIMEDGPVLDTTKFKPYKFELIGYDLGFRVKQMVGAFFVYQRAETSGIVINAASTDWCSSRGFEGENSNQVKQITSNMIHKLLNQETVFSEK